MYHIKKDRRRRRSADVIMKTMMECLESKLLSEITVTEIQRRSGISRSTFYRLFDSKEDVIRYACDQFFDRFWESADAEGTASVIDGFSSYLVSNAGFLISLERNGLLGALQAGRPQNYRRLSKVLDLPVSGDRRWDYYANALQAILASFIAVWIRRGMRDDVELVQSALMGFVNPTLFKQQD